MESGDISLGNSCRLCLKRLNGEVLSVSIFETDTPTMCPSIPMKIKTCVSIHVQAEDFLPQCICKDCHNKLDDFFAFKQVCWAADLQLKTLLGCTTTHNGIKNDKGVLRGAYGDTPTKQGSEPCQDSTKQGTPAQVTVSPLDMGMFSPNTIKTEPYYEEEECGLAEAMELDALSNDSEIGASTAEPSMTEHLPILDTISSTCDNQGMNESEIKMEQPEHDSNRPTTARTEMTNQYIFYPVKMEIITEQEPLNENIPLAYYTNRQIIGVQNGNFIYNNDDEGISESTTERANERRNSFRKNHGCDACGESFRRLSDLQAHLDAHLPTELRRFVCCVCPEAFSDKRYLKHHESTVHSTGPHRCKECVASCPTLYELRQHISKQHPQSLQYTCPHCGRGFPQEAAYTKHEAACLPSPLFECDVCGLALNDIGALAYHRSTAHRTASIATVAPLFVCDVCGLALEDKEALICHHTTHHSTDSPALVCVTSHDLIPRGGKMAKLADEARQARPRDAHTFSCKPCGLVFKHKGALICHQAFYHRLEMNANIASTKIFTCEVCHVIFKGKDRYIIHKESHQYDRLNEENRLAVKQLHHFITLSQNDT